MSVFDLLFIGCFFATLGNGVWIAGLLLRRRWKDARRHSIRLGAAIALYMLVVFSVGQLSTRRILAPNELLRYDDWCLGVQKTTFTDALGETHAEAGKRFLVVTLKAISTARRAQAAPKGALAYVLDEADARFDVSKRAQTAFENVNGAQPELTTRLDPHGSFLTSQVYEVPRAANELFIGHRHGSGSRFPGMFIIGTGFRRATVIRLQIDSGR